MKQHKLGMRKAILRKDLIEHSSHIPFFCELGLKKNQMVTTEVLVYGMMVLFYLKTQGRYATLSESRCVQSLSTPLHSRLVISP